MTTNEILAYAAVALFAALYVWWVLKMEELTQY